MHKRHCTHFLIHFYLNNRQHFVSTNPNQSNLKPIRVGVCLLEKGSNPEQLEINLNAELHHLRLWCSLNKVSVNSATTNIAIIPPKRTKAPISHLNLLINGTPVNIVNSAKYLGVIINNKLNFHEQINPILLRVFDISPRGGGGGLLTVFTVIPLFDKFKFMIGALSPLFNNLNQKLWKHQIWHAGLCSTKIFIQIAFELMASSIVTSRRYF